MNLKKKKSQAQFASVLEARDFELKLVCEGYRYIKKKTRLQKVGVNFVSSLTVPDSFYLKTLSPLKVVGVKNNLRITIKKQFEYTTQNEKKFPRFAQSFE